MKNQMKWLICVLALTGCHKEMQQSATSQSHEDIVTKLGTFPSKTLYYIKRDTVAAFAKDGVLSGRPYFIGGQLQVQDTMKKLLFLVDTVNHSVRVSKSKIWVSNAVSKTPIAGWKNLSYKYFVKPLVLQRVIDGAIVGEPTGYQYHYTFYHDYTMPGTNYMVTVYWNASNGHIMNAAIRTDVWGYGNSNSYVQTNEPPPYVSIDWTNNTITWTAQGNTNVGFNFNIFGISGFNFTSNMPVDFSGWLQFSNDMTDPKSGTSTVRCGGNHVKEKSSDPRPL